jgi:hypothetical protein
MAEKVYLLEPESLPDHVQFLDEAFDGPERQIPGPPGTA